jgi:type VI secretion system protein ImpB
MSKRESIQKKLQRVRPPRVQLTYDVEIGDAIEQKELPFVMGVVGDFAGDSEIAQPRLKDKKFVQIDGDNFDEVMTAIEPRAKFRAPNKLTEKGGEFAVDLAFRSMEDFRPEAVVKQVEPLNMLVEARTRLADLRNKIAGSEKLEDLLNDVLRNTDKLNRLNREAGHEEKQA